MTQRCIVFADYLTHNEELHSLSLRREEVRELFGRELRPIETAMDIGHTVSFLGGKAVHFKAHGKHLVEEHPNKLLVAHDTIRSRSERGGILIAGPEEDVVDVEWFQVQERLVRLPLSLLIKQHVDVAVVGDRPF